MDANTLIGEKIIKHLLCRLSEKFSDSVFGFNYSLCSVYFTLGMLVFG